MCTLIPLDQAFNTKIELIHQLANAPGYYYSGYYGYGYFRYKYYNKYYGREKDEEPAKDSSAKAVS